MLRCYIENKNISVYGTEQRYPISDGAVFIENYNETLDSGSILIQQLPAKIDIEPYDVVVIESYDSDITINTRRMCIDTYTCTQTSLNPPIYKYEVSLFSETKSLEGIILPSLSIRKRFSGHVLSVYEYIERYNDLYGPKHYENGVLVNTYTLSSEIANFTNQCPEMQWNQPTFREVLNDLMMVYDCIATLKDNVIGCINVSITGNEITDYEGINYIQESQNSDDYVSELKMNLVNAANNSIISNQDYTQIVENIGFRNDESYLLTTENMLLQTNLPIWKIFECKMILNDVACKVVYKDNTTGLDTEVSANLDLSIDLTPYILEHAEWLTKDVYYGAWTSGSGLTLDTNYRNMCLYFKRGSKNIENFNLKVNTSFLFINNTYSVFSLILNSTEMQDEINSVGELFYNLNIKPLNPDTTYRYSYYQHSIGMDIGSYYKSAEFSVKYEPIDECVFTATKDGFKTHKRQVIDHQTNSYIDINRQGLLEYLKANRLGNQMALVNARYYKDESDIPALADKINNKIIFRKEISVYNNYINVNYLTTENYVLRNYFTGVKSKLRSWRILSGAEAFVRADLVKFYVNSNIQDKVDTVNNEYLIPSHDSLQWYLDNFKYCTLYTIDKNGYYLPQQTAYAGTNYNVNTIQVEFSKHKIGNKTIIFTIRMLDNRYAGNYVSNYNGTDGRVEQKGTKYTDDDGEIVDAVFCFYNRYNGVYIGNDETVDRALKPLVHSGAIIGGSNGNTFNSADMVAKIPVRLYKDNKEIMQVSIQFEINEDANDIYLGKVE